MNDCQYHEYHLQVKQDLIIESDEEKKKEKFILPLQAVASSFVIGKNKFESFRSNSLLSSSSLVNKFVNSV